ncbi:hypothetical protein [Persephonella sp.]
MKVLNLVFNRLGNNISILIDYPEHQIQIWDQVQFSIENKDVEIASVCADTDYMKIRIDIFSGEDAQQLKILFEKEKVVIPDLCVLQPEDEGFSGTVDKPQIFFKAGMDPELKDLIRGDRIFIPQQDFFKKIIKIFMS